MPRFRTARPDDIPPVMELMAGYYEEDGYRFRESAAREAVLALVANDTLGHFWVATVDGEVVGYLAVTLGFSMEYQGRDAFIDELYVAERWRGQGIGAEAMRVAETYCKERQVRALHLEVERHRSAAKALYEREGFQEHGRCLMTKLLRRHSGGIQR